MGRGKLTRKEIEELRENPYVVSVDADRIKYSDEFKRMFIWKYINGERPGAIFRSAGFDTNALGSKRVERACARWKELYCSGALDVTDISGENRDPEKDTEEFRQKAGQKVIGGYFEESEQVKLLKKLLEKHEEVIKKQRAEIVKLKENFREGRK